jgi:hypothetical protein
VDVNRYDIVFVPGGHGAMVDLPESAEVQQLLSKAWGRGAVVASVCHGPAALVDATDANGAPLLRGRRVCCFTNEGACARAKCAWRRVQGQVLHRTHICVDLCFIMPPFCARAQRRRRRR